VGLVDILPNSCDLGYPVWMCGQTEMMDKRHEMPIITPTYPCQNATANVSKSTLKIMQEEFARGRDVCKRVEAGTATWSELFEPLDAISKYPNLLQVQVGDTLSFHKFLNPNPATSAPVASDTRNQSRVILSFFVPMNAKSCIKSRGRIAESLALFSYIACHFIL